MNFDEQVDYLMRGTYYGDEELAKSMAEELRQRLIEADSEGRPLRVYCGYDPRTTDIHIGHTITMRKLRQFQELGHEVTFLIGTYTSLIGDPSDKDKMRPQLTPDEVEYNARTYAEQAFKILDPEKTRIRYNSEWLAKLTFADLINLASNFTIQQYLTRENFRLRWENGDAIYLHETFYSIMQGYDAYSLKADVQVGGTDQLFNIVTAARKVMNFLGEKPNIAIIMAILVGTDGEVKMSKSIGNHIPILATPDDMYGKVMSIPDSAMDNYFPLVTRWPEAEIKAIETGLEQGRLHPRDVKMKLAREIVEIFHDQASAASAEENFVRVFQKHDQPEDMPEYTFRPGQSVLDVLQDSGMIQSRSEGRRLISQNGVRLDGEVLDDPNQVLPHTGVLQAGKRRFTKIIQ
ncbi:MAG: tyrosine--tRNA ligase [Anaerolineales bacterium]